MAIIPITTVPVLLPTTNSFGEIIRDGQILNARVTAKLSDTLVRLAIAGQSIDVATPKPLPVGTTLAFKAQWQGRQLLLVAKAPDTGASATLPTPSAPAPQTPPAGFMEPVKATLAKIQAMTVEAMLAGKGSTQSLPAEQQPVATQAQSQSAAATPQSQNNSVQAGANAATSTGIAAPPDDRSQDAWQPNALTVERSEAGQRPAAPEMPGGQARAERMTSFTVDVPLFLPGNKVPLRLQIMHDEGAQSESGGRDVPRLWMVRFGAQAGTLGMIHAAISMIDGHIGVQLWAERDDTADWFKENAGQLREALSASDLKLDAVRVAHGSPSMEAQEIG